MKSQIALFDMDGTLFDYDGQLRKDLEALRSPQESLPDNLHDESIPWLKVRMQLIKSQSGWWRNLPKFQLGWDIYELARSMAFDCHVLTKGPWSKPQAWAEKLECIQHHFENNIGIDIVSDSVGPDGKRVVGAKSNRYGKILVDDWPPFVMDWLSNRPRGLVIMPAHDYNADFTHPRAIRYDGTNIEKVRRAFEIVKKREDGEPLVLE